MFFYNVWYDSTLSADLSQVIDKVSLCNYTHFNKLLNSSNRLAEKSHICSCGTKLSPHTPHVWHNAHSQYFWNDKVMPLRALQKYICYIWTTLVKKRKNCCLTYTLMCYIHMILEDQNSRVGRAFLWCRVHRYERSKEDVLDCILRIFLFVFLSDLNDSVPDMFLKTPKIWHKIALFDLFSLC